tara:strand:+ start:2783 stop:3049 length:267 start_codon:yes stop_codon:yes gene_type:complete
LTSTHKKIKHLNHTMIVWAEENKIRSKRTDDYEIPQRNGIDWKFDLKFVTKLDFMLGDGKDLTSKELQMCNQLYNFYSKTYIKNLLRK